LKPIYIIFGSVNGGAKLVAHELRAQLESDGRAVKVLDKNSWDFLTAEPAICLVIVATTGAGDLPKNISPFFEYLCLKDEKYEDLSYAVLGLGDSCFGETFCMAGKRLDSIFADLNAKPILPLTTIDASDVRDPMEVAVPWLDKVCHRLEYHDAISFPMGM